MSWKFRFKSKCRPFRIVDWGKIIIKLTDTMSDPCRQQEPRTWEIESSPKSPAYPVLNICWMLKFFDFWIWVLCVYQHLSSYDSSNSRHIIQYRTLFHSSSLTYGSCKLRFFKILFFKNKNLPFENQPAWPELVYFL